MWNSLIGDLLITTGSPSESPVRIPGQTWQEMEALGKFRFFTTLPCDQWRGFPFQRFQNENWIAFILGELYGESRGFPEFKKLTGYDTHQLHHINGHFLLVCVNRKSEELHLLTSRFGTLHGYYSLGLPCRISTCFISAAGNHSAVNLDWAGITGFFKLGFFPHDYTWLKNIKAAKPATENRFKSGKGFLESKRLWQWKHQPATRNSHTHLLSEFSQRYAEVVGELAGKGRVGLPISGGLDSRSTVTALSCHSGKKEADFFNLNIWPYSYGYSEDSAELDIAGRIAAKTGMSLSRFIIRPYLFGDIKNIVAASECFHDICQSRQHFISSFLSSQTDAVLAAHWGDVWLDDMGFSGFPVSKPASNSPFRYALQKMTKKGHHWLLEHLQTGNSSAREGLEQAEHSLEECFEGYAHIDCPDFRIKAFKTDQWSFRWTVAGLRAFQAASFPRLPFYDNRLTDFFMRLPTSMVKGRQFQIDYIKKYSPDLARIPWQAKGANLYWYPYQNTLLLPKRVLGKLKRVLMKFHPIERNWEIQFFQEKGWEKLVQHLLEEQQPLHEYFPPPAIRKLLTQFKANPAGSGLGYPVSILLTFGAWLQYFKNRLS